MTNQFRKEEASFGNHSPKEEAPLDQSDREHPEKRRPGSYHAGNMVSTVCVYHREGVLTDAVFAPNEQRFPCHRATMSANSAYLRALFTGGLTEATIHLQPVPVPSLNFALDYKHGEKVAIRQDNVAGLLELSHVLRTSKLRVACATFLEGHLSLGNCLPFLKLATSFSFSSLAENSRRLVLGGFVEVSHHEEFLEMDVQELKGCLSSERLAIPNEVVVFEAVMRWVRHDLTARKEALGDLLGHVHLPLLDPVYFLEKVETEELLRESPVCLPWLQEARRSYILGADLSSPRSRPRRAVL